MWEGYALALVLIATYAAIEMWGILDARLKEAAETSIGIETPLTMIAGVKSFTLLLLAGLTSLISGYAMGYIV